MAFDHEDTDALFENAILPVLKAHDVVPVIINRREDNRDINNQIIEQLNTCDFCITDLTYARPSVYFEAGYAQREVEVIYTVRSDHLRMSQPDELRVHFDLQMKPLIQWSNPDDKKFPEKLERRLTKTVLRDWNITQRTSEREKKQREDFNHMPLNERLVTIRKGGLRILDKLGYSSWAPLEGYIPDTDRLSYRQMLRYLDSFASFISGFRSKRSLSVTTLRVKESLTLRVLRDEFGYRFLRSQWVPHLDGDKIIEESRPVIKSIEHHVLCSIKAIPQARIMSAMPSLSWDPSLQCYRANVEWKYKGSKRDKRKKGWNTIEVTASVPRSLFVYFIDGIQSIPEFDAAMGVVAERIKSNQPRG
jgi:hypothetical protein